MSDIVLPNVNDGEIGANVYSITDFGARVCDDLQTDAIQAAIDAAHAAGGGEVTVPEGVFRTGGLELKSGVTFHLLQGAILEGSRDPEDYMAPLERLLKNVDHDDPRLKLGRSAQPFSRWNNAIFRAVGAKDIAIIGEKYSYIDGQNCYDEQGEEKYRGPHAINFWYCSNVVFRGYTIRNSANWAHAVHNSANITAEKLTVLGGHDGFDVRTCDNVRIEDCVFRTGDDGIAGFDNIGVVIRNCILDCSCNALRFGGTDVLVEKCRATAPTSFGHRYRMPPELQRLAVNDGRKTRHGLCTVFCYYCDNRAVIRKTPGNIVIRDCVFDSPIRIFALEFDGQHLWCCNRSLSSIAFEHCEFTDVGDEPFYIHGDKKEPLSITLKDCVVTPSPVAAKGELGSARYFRQIILQDVKFDGYTDPRILTDCSGKIDVLGGTPVMEISNQVCH